MTFTECQIYKAMCDTNLQKTHSRIYKISIFFINEALCSYDKLTYYVIFAKYVLFDLTLGSQE